MTRYLLPLLLASLLPSAVFAQKKSAAPAAGDYLKISDKWLVMRFVQSSVGPKLSYKVSFVLPPGAKTPKVTRSSGSTEVDGIAFDYAKHLISQNSQLREQSKSKELVFNFDVTPPVLDASEKSEEGRKPIPAGEEFHTPTPPYLYSNDNMMGGGMSSEGKYAVVFPAGGGYAKLAMVLSSCGSPGKDLFYIRNAVLNWKTSKKSDRPFGFSFDMKSRRMGFGGRYAL
ncbi:MAG: hypothetical protein JSR82_23195 [Verrucomicrobia bacterium]|nr:hypothetical protein [Verrucomicrobiota bacterium]